VTRGNKVLWLLLFELALVGGAAGAAIYVYRGREVLPAQAALAGCQKAQSALTTRAMLTDALLALYQGNPALAFERVTRAQFSSQAAGLKLERDLDEVMMMLADPVRIKQTPQRIQEIADRLLQPPSGAKGPAPAPRADAPAPKGEAPAPAKGDAPAPAAKGEAPAPAAAKGEAPAPAKADAPASTPAPAAKGEAPAPAKAEAPAPAPAAAPAGAGIGAAAVAAPAPAAARPRTEQSFEEGYRAILDAKTALIAGTGGEGVIGKLARARVMLDEAGRGDAVGEELDAAIGALRRHDEPRARSEIEAALKKLR
jgi:hypothetical protein